MSGTSEDPGRGGSRSGVCAGCGAALTPRQRYCVECGARRGALPTVVRRRLESLGRRSSAEPPDAGPPPKAGAPADGNEGPGPDGEAEQSSFWSFMPSPQAAAVAVMALLAAGAIIGTVTSPLAQSAGFAPILLRLLQPRGSAEVAATTPEPVASEPPEAVASEAAPTEVTVEPAPPVEPTPEAQPQVAPPAAEPPLEEFPEEVLPPVKHVWLIVLREHGYEESFGKASASPYLAKELAGEGELLANYYAVAGGGLANEIALVSGQGPTPQTAVNCPEYTPFAPAPTTAAATDPEDAGQALGSGCVYPSETQSLAAALAEHELSWRVYDEGIATGLEPGQPTTCRHPAPAAADPNQAVLPGVPYLTWRDPFVYFASVVEGPECAADDVGLERLPLDLRRSETTPSFSYVVPDACHDGGEAPCEPGQPAGLAGAEPFLRGTVAEIQRSQAYAEGGLIAITFDEAPQEGPNADSSSCCDTPEYPNLPPAATPPPAAQGPVKSTGGGGRVGMLLISPFVEPGAVDESGYYNHFSFLRSVQELLGVEPPLGYAGAAAVSGFDGTVFRELGS